MHKWETIPEFFFFFKKGHVTELIKPYSTNNLGKATENIPVWDESKTQNVKQGLHFKKSNVVFGQM